MRRRLEKVVKKLVIIAVIGIVYAIWMLKTSIGIPCPIRFITGFRCPGCGISHMCISLLHGEIREAFYSNRIVFLLLPIMVVIIVRQLYRYIRYGRERLDRGENIMVGIMVILLLVWGIIRNLPVFYYLN